MSSYSKSTDFAAKDSLPSGNANKVVSGTEINTEFNAIETAVNSKANTASPTFTGTVSAGTVNIDGGNIDGTVIGSASAAAGTFTTITGTVITGTSLVIGAADVTEAELEILDGATVTTAELNVLDGITSTVAELNILDGVTATTAELNILDGVTATFTELNLLDGVTATTAELNYTDGVTSAIQTQLNTKAPLASPTFTGIATLPTVDINAGNIDGTVIGAAAAAAGSFTTVTASGAITGASLVIGAADVSEAELEILDGATVTTAELNVLDGITSTVAELNILDGVTATASEINVLDGVTATTAELNYTDGVTSAIQTQLDLKAPLADPNFTGTAEVGTMDIASGSITDSSGAISFGNENLSTTGTLGAGATTVTTFTSTGIDDNATSNAVTIDSSGRVGIGTSSPSETLSVENVSNNAILLNSPANRYNAVGFQSAGVDKWWMGRADTDIIAGNAFFIGGDAGNATDAGGFSARLVIDSSGNVGIGTSSPASLVAGGSSPVLSIGGADATLTTGEKAGSLSFISADTSFTPTYADGIASEIVCVSDSAVGGAYGLAFYTATTGGSNRGERLRIDSSGKVGIGTSSPSAKLEVNGGGAATAGGTLVVRQDGDTDADGIALTSSNATSHRFWKDSGGQLNIGPSNLPSALVQDLTGRVGIGTSSPSATSKLHVIGAAGASNTAIYVPQVSSNVALTTNSQNAGTKIHDIQWYGEDLASLSVNVGGNGVDWDLGSDGSVGANTLKFTNVAGTERMRIDSSGNTIVGGTSAGAASAVTLYADGKAYPAGGIYLGGTSAANLLDDYEEGTFTATIKDSDDDSIIVTSTQTCTYTKIGRLVHVSLFILENSVTSHLFVGYPYVNMPFSSNSLLGCGSYPFYYVSIGGIVSGYLLTSTVRLILCDNRDLPFGNSAVGETIGGSVRYYDSLTYATN